MPPTVVENEHLRIPPAGVTEDGGNRSVVPHFVPADYYDTLIELKEAILGTAWVEDGVLMRTLPWKHYTDSLQHAVKIDYRGIQYAGREAATVPLKPMTGGRKVGFHSLLVTYANLPFPVGPGTVDVDDPNVVNGNAVAASETERYTTKVPYPGREFITPQSGVFYVGASGSRTQYQSVIPLVVPFQELDVTWWRVPAPSCYPAVAIKNCTGKVNATTLTLPSLPDGVTEYEPETIHLLTVRPEICYLPDSSYAVNLRYEFKYRGGTNPGGVTPINWNTYPDASGAFIRLYRGQTSTTGVFQTAEMNDLFAPP